MAAMICVNSASRPEACHRCAFPAEGLPADPDRAYIPQAALAAGGDRPLSKLGRASRGLLGLNCGIRPMPGPRGSGFSVRTNERPRSRRTGPRPIEWTLLMMKLTRPATGSIRCILSLLLAILILAGHGAGACAQGDAAGQLRTFYDALLSTMKNGPSLGAEGRYRALKPVIARNFDLPYMVRRAVGPAWASSSAADQQEITEAFWRYITATYADQFDHFSGQQFQVLGQAPYGSDVIVHTRIVRADGTTRALNYLTHRVGNDWRIADIYLDGTVSELAVRRAEFTSVIRERGMGGLIATLDQKAKAFTDGAAK
jgi:phospholipid transport system substrate-binding protein